MGKDSNLREMLATGRQRAGRPRDGGQTTGRVRPRRVAVKIDEVELANVRRALRFLHSHGYPDLEVPDVLENAVRRHLAELKAELNDGRDFPEAPAPAAAARLGYPATSSPSSQ